MTAPECRLCPLPLDFAATANGLDVCTTCALQALRASRHGTRAVVVSRAEVAPANVRPLGKITAEEWSVFTSALAQVARGGVVHQNDVRPLIRGRIFHKHVGPCYSRAMALGLLKEIGSEPSGDRAGRNTHHDSAVYAYAAAMNGAAA